MTTAFSIQPVRRRDRIVLVLSGELDATCAALVQPAVDLALADGRRDLTVDAAALTFCDSSGLRALTDAHDRVSEAGGVMELTGVHGQVHRILAITGLDEILNISPDGGAAQDGGAKPAAADTPE